MVDILFVLGNLHRFVRQRRKPAPAPAEPAAEPATEATPHGLPDGRKTAPKNSDASFLVGVVFAALVLVGVIAAFWSLL